MKLSVACPSHLLALVFMYILDICLYNPHTSYNHHILSLTSWGHSCLSVIAFNLILLKYLDNFDCLLCRQ